MKAERKLKDYIQYAVSIPYRFNERGEYVGYKGEYKLFQFLIGSMKECHSIKDPSRQRSFNSL